MRVISAKVSNFGSYKELEFDFTNQRLTLIQGLTGSGKSTLCDLIPWCLFGKTAKNGSVDEVLTWPGDEVTKVTLFLENVTIHRSRGSKPKDNDLMFWPADGKVIRGKDLNDTQKLINSLLGIDIDLYLASSYFHEFSQTAQFFTTTAKNRRMICEQIVDLSLATKLQPLLADNKKSLAKQANDLFTKISLQANTKLNLENTQRYETERAKEWMSDHFKRKEAMEVKYDTFESNRTKNVKNAIMAYEIDLQTGKSAKKCSGCGKPVEGNPNYENLYLKNQIESTKTAENPYLEQMANIESEVNPYANGVKDYTKQISESETKIQELTVQREAIMLEADDLDLLEDIVANYRSTSIINTIDQIQSQTNQLLTDHFDGEIKVLLEVNGADKLEVNVEKDGNKASFTQLSKGQRQMLKLCFGVAVMQAAANNSGVKLNQLWFDESLDGCDDSVKMKAIGLLETLSQYYDTIYVVEHSETVKAMIDNKYTVQLINGESHIEKN